jgi:hypothetical protein
MSPDFRGQLAALLVEECRALAPLERSLSFGPTDGSYLVLVALDVDRVREVERLLPSLAGVADDPLVTSLRARIAELQAEIERLRAPSPARPAGWREGWGPIVQVNGAWRAWLGVGPFGVRSLDGGATWGVIHGDDLRVRAVISAPLPLEAACYDAEGRRGPVARLVHVASTGEPGLADVIARETLNPHLHPRECACRSCAIPF